jgi:PKD repeat protein
MSANGTLLGSGANRPIKRQSRRGGSKHHPRRVIAATITIVAFAASLLMLPAMPQAAAAAVIPHQRQIAVGANASSAASFALTLPAGASTVAGRHLVVAYLFSGTSGESVTSVTDTAGNAYRIDVVKGNIGTSGLKVVIASAKIASPISAGDTVTVTQSTASTYHAMQLYEFDNFAPTSWADKTATGNNSTAATSVTTSTTATTSQADEMIVAIVGFGDKPATLTSSPGWTDSDTAVAGPTTKQKSLAVAVKEVTSTDTFAYSGQLSTASQSVSALVTYRTVTAPTNPVASFTASPTSGPAPLAVQFTNTSTGSPTSWAWDFGDGASSTSQHPSHTYAAAGTYTVVLTVANAIGSDTVTRAGLISASPGSIGYQDMSTQGTGGAATGEKPESKLWWNDGSWWGVLFDSASQGYHIFRLDRTQQTWIDTRTVVDNRSKSRADTLWDGQHLYVSSHVFATSAATVASGNPARLYRYSYDSTSKTFSLDAGYPATISDFSSETLTIDKDTTGTIWATWVQGSRVYMNRTTGGDAAWGTPFALPAQGADTLDADDISAVAAFGGNKLGVMWSNQTVSVMYFAVHHDGDPVDTWELSRTAVQGPKSADDHINLKALQGDPAGHIFAAVKTSLDDAGATSSAPQILVLVRDPVTGDWSSAPFGRISDCHTRPILMLDSQRQVLHVFATAPDSGCPFSGSAGTIFEKTSPMSNVSFPLGRGTPVIRDMASPNLNNVTSSKQSVTDASGLVVMASNDVTKRYWHADVTLQ